jgi:uncharacterized repeat protein (TIGR02059 family)
MVDVIAPMLVISGMDIPKTSYSGTSVMNGSVMGATIMLTYDENLDQGSVPAASDFTVTAGTVSDVSVSGSTLTLTVSSALTESTAITVGYTPGANALQDAAGNQAAAIDPAVSVMNRIDTTAPVLDLDVDDDNTEDSPTMSIDGVVVMLHYTEAGSGIDESSVPSAASYVVRIPAAPLVDADDDPATPMTRGDTPSGTRDVNPIAVSIDGNVVSLTLAADHRLLNGETDVLVTYTKATFGDDLSGVIQDDAGNDAAEVLLPNQAVLTNRIDSAAPTLTSSEVSADGLSIVLTYTDTASDAAPVGSGLNPDFVPATSSYMVEITRNGVATRVSPSRVVISDATTPTGDGVYETVTLTLPAPVRVTTGDTLTLAYDASAAGNPLQDMAGNEAADAVAGEPAVTVDDLVDVLPVLTVTDDGGDPAVATEPKMSADGLSVLLTFSTALDEDSVPASGRFSVTINGLSVPLSMVSVDNGDYDDNTGTPDVGRVTLTLPSYLKVAAVNSPAVMVSYTDLTPGQDDRSGVLQHATGKRDVATFPATPVFTAAIS